LISLLAVVLIGQLHHFEFSSIISPKIAGDSFLVSITARDINNNLVDTYNGQPWVYSSLGPEYSNKQVTFNGGVCQENVMVSLAASMTLICNDVGASVTGQSNTFTIVPNVPMRLLVLVPAETHDPGTTDGKDGSVIGQTAGNSFDVQVYATDAWYNLVDTIDHDVRVTSSDQFVAQQQMQLVNGTRTFGYAFRTASTREIYCVDLTNTSIQSATSASIPVSAGAYADLLVVLPGELHVPGDTTSSVTATPGKSGEPLDQYEGTDFQVSVYATDTMWNMTSLSGNTVGLMSDFSFSNPQPETLSNGQAQFLINFTFAGDNQNLWADDGTIESSYRSYLDILAQQDTTNDTTLVDTLLKAYPNPLGIEGEGSMYFEYRLPASANVSFLIFDPFGNLVLQKEIDAGDVGAQAGLNRIAWTGRNDKNQRVATGLYYVVLKAWTHTTTIIKTATKVGVVW
jgi:hypothetical protein